MRIKKGVIEHVLAHTEKDTPIEACGFLLGSEDVVELAVAITNTEGREDHFTFDPQEQYDAYKRAGELGIRIIGVYHSHPRTPPQPSVEDIRLVFDPDQLHLIASLAGGERVAKAFWIRDSAAIEEPLIVEG
jgi:[CysO sulfur-carrier protein]-S-L-cysteine hydrolase